MKKVMKIEMKIVLAPLIAILAMPVGLKAFDVQISAVKDILSMQVREDGRFDVICRDGHREIATEEDILSERVCSFPSPTPTPTPTPVPGYQVDVLFLIDDSGSMEDHQKNLALNADKFIAAVQTWKKTDFHIGVATTDMKDKNREGKLFGFPHFVSPASPDLISTLKHHFQPGTQGDATEMSIGASLAALSAPLTTGYNAGFLREQANLAIVYISDAEDQSNLAIDSALQQLAAIKGGNTSLIHIYGMMSFPGCPSDSEGVEPVRMKEFYAKTDAKVYNLCDPNFGENLKEIGRSIGADLRR